MIPMADLPFFLCMPTYKTNPSIRPCITGKHIPTEADGVIIITEKQDSLSAKLATYQADYLETKVDHISFAKMLAKIALGYCVIVFGRDGFTPMTTPLILGKTNGYRDIVSSSQMLRTPEPRIQIEQGYHHQLTHKITTNNDLICVRIELFTNLEAPAYYVMAGTVGQSMLRVAATPGS
jgi:hypothetical protein